MVHKVNCFFRVDRQPILGTHAMLAWVSSTTWYIKANLHTGSHLRTQPPIVTLGHNRREKRSSYIYIPLAVKNIVPIRCSQPKLTQLTWSHAKQRLLTAMPSAVRGSVNKFHCTPNSFITIPNGARQTTAAARSLKLYPCCMWPGFHGQTAFCECSTSNSHAFLIHYKRLWFT